MSSFISNTLDASFCVDAYIEAVRLYGSPEIINTDQGSQFTSVAFVAAVATAGARLSMDGKGSWTDNIFIERFWRSLKYEEVYLRAYDTVADAKRIHREIQYGTTTVIIRTQNTRQDSCNIIRRRTAHGIIGRTANTLIIERNQSYKPEPAYMTDCHDQPPHL